MPRYIPENSRRVIGMGDESQPPEEDVANASGLGGQGVEVDNYRTESEPESESEPKSNHERAGDRIADPEANQMSQPQRGLGRIGVAFTSGELAAMSHEDLLQNFMAFQQGKVNDETQELDHTSTDQPIANSNTPTNAPVDLTEQQRHIAEMAHARKSLCTLADLKDGNSVRPTVRDAYGVVQYWTVNEHGVKRLTPAWEEKFETNVKEWGVDFIRQCRVESEMPPLVRDYLRTVPDATFLKALKDGAWKTYSGNGRKASQGTFEMSRAAKGQRNRENSRRSTKATQRAKASKNTCVDSTLPEFAFLYCVRAQSLPVADKNDLSREVVLVPFFASEEVLAIKESLDSKIGPKSGNKVKSLEYVKVDVPVEKLGECTWPDWAISKQWKQDHPQEYQKSMHLIDPARTVMPNVTEFTELYKAPPRNYLPSVPRGVELPKGYNCQSVAPALVREDDSGPSLDSTPHTKDTPTAPVAPVLPEPQTRVKLPLPPPAPAVPQLASQKCPPYEHQLNGGHYVDGEFVATSPAPADVSGAPVSKQVFGVPIDPKLLHQDQYSAAGPSTSGRKRAAENGKAVPKRQKREVPALPPRRSNRLQKEENIGSRDGEGGMGRLLLKIPRKE